MKKPLGVSLSAVCALLGSLLTLLFFVAFLLILFLSPAGRPLPPEAKLGMLIGLAMFGLFGSWGTTTAIGLFRMRNWARISIIIYSVLLAFTGLAAGPAIFLVPPPPTAPPNYAAVRGAVAGFYGVLGLLGAFWLYYFSRRATREAFGETATGESGGRPLSISIIGWLLLIGGVACVLMSPLRMPVSAFIWIVTGWSAAAWYIAFGIIYAYAGYGLLRLNPIARKIAIAVYCLGAINAIVFFVFPGSDARFERLMSRFHFGTGSPPPLHFGAFMIVPLTLGMALPLWFLITRRGAFQAPNGNSLPEPG